MFNEAEERGWMFTCAHRVSDAFLLRQGPCTGRGSSGWLLSKCCYAAPTLLLYNTSYRLVLDLKTTGCYYTFVSVQTDSGVCGLFWWGYHSVIT